MILHIEMDDLILSVKYDRAADPELSMVGYILDVPTLKAQEVAMSPMELSVIAQLMFDADATAYAMSNAENTVLDFAYASLKNCIERHGWDGENKEVFRPIP